MLAPDEAPLLTPEWLTGLVPELAPLAVPVLAPPLTAEPVPLPGFVLLALPPHAAMATSTHARGNPWDWLTADG